MENGPCRRRRVLVSTEAAELLETAGKGSLGMQLVIFLLPYNISNIYNVHI